MLLANLAQRAIFDERGDLLVDGLLQIRVLLVVQDYGSGRVDWIGDL